MTLLTQQQINDALSQLKGWSYKDKGIEKNFVFKDFKETLSIMMGIGMIAEEMNHHPEWFNVYKTVEVTLKTHDVNSLSDLDKKLSEKMDFFLLNN